jgi:hypothetical protein
MRFYTYTLLLIIISFYKYFTISLTITSIITGYNNNYNNNNNNNNNNNDNDNNNDNNNNFYYISDSDNQYNNNIIRINEEEFKNSILSRKFVQSYPISLYKAFQQTKLNTDNILSSFINLITQRDTPINILKKYISEFNYQSLFISSVGENVCNELMLQSYNYNIYKNWKSINYIHNSKTDLYYKSYKESIKQNSLSSLLGTITSVYVSPMTGDIITPFYMASYLGKNIYDYLYIKLINNNYNTPNNILEQNLLTEEERQILNDKLFTFSKIYCMNTFHLQIIFDDNTHNITIVGDKIEYSWMNNLINVLISNINLQINLLKELNTNKNDKYYDKYNEDIQTLISCEQKLRVLKKIVHSLSDIVSYSFYTIISKHLINLNDYTIDKIKYILNERIHNIILLTEQLTKQFPEYEEQLKQNKLIMNEQLRLNKIENELKVFKQKITKNQNEFNKNYTKYNILGNFNLFKESITTYIYILYNTIDLASLSIKNITQHFVKLFASIPIGIIDGIGNSLNTIFWRIISNIWLVIILAFVLFKICKKIFGLLGLSFKIVLFSSSI